MHKLTLTRDERKAIDWIGNRYRHGDELCHCLLDGQCQPDVNWDSENTITFTVPPMQAQTIASMAIEDDFNWACFDDNLSSKLSQFAVAVSPWFDGTTLTRDIPSDCIHDCSRSGDVSRAVEYWLRRLSFTVPRDEAERYLSNYGAWTRQELRDMEDEEIAAKVLWIACCDINDGDRWYGLSE